MIILYTVHDISPSFTSYFNSCFYTICIMKSVFLGFLKISIDSDPWKGHTA